MTIDALPTAPSRSRPLTFADEGDAFMAALVPFGAQLNAAEININAKEASAVAAAAAAAASETAAASSSNATVWVSGTTYAIGNVRWSPTNFQAYRRKTAGAGTTDPSLDSTNWAYVSTVPPMTGHVGEVLYNDGTTAYWKAPAAAASVFNQLNFGGF